MHKTIAFRAAALACMLGVVPVAAASTEAVSAARAHFDNGEKCFDLGDFAKALDEFREAYHLK